MYQEQPYVNPYVGTIAQMITEPARARANAIRVAAQAQARAQEIGGQAMGGAIQNIGQQIAAIPAQVQQQKAQAQEQQARDLQVKAIKQRQADLDALDKAYATPGGRDGILNALPGHLRSDVEKQFNEADRSALELRTARVKAQEATQSYLGGLASTVKAHGYDPQAAQLALSHAKEAFQDDPAMTAELQKMQAQILQNPTPEAIRALVEPLIPAAPTKPAEPFTLKPGETRYGPDNAVIASIPAEAKAPGSVDAALFAAYQKGDTAEVQRLLRFKAQEAAATRAPKETTPINELPPGVVGDKALEGQNEQTKNIVKLLTDYKMQLPSGMALRTPEWQHYLGLARAYDPTFDATQYSVRQKVRADFTSGKSAQNIRSLNTAVGHLDTLQQKADALNNAGLQFWNKVKNTTLAQTGDKRIAEFDAAANAVAGELANVFKGTAGTDQEIKAWRNEISAIESPEQLKGSISTAIELLNSRLYALQSQYEAGLGKPLDFSFLNAKSQAILDKLHGNAPTATTTSAVTVTAPNGQTFEFKSQADADAFKAKAGIQ